MNLTKRHKDAMARFLVYLLVFAWAAPALADTVSPTEVSPTEVSATTVTTPTVVWSVPVRVLNPDTASPTLQFTLDWSWPGPDEGGTSCSGDGCCLCLNRLSDDDHDDPNAQPIACTDAAIARCDAVLEGTPLGDGDFDIGLSEAPRPDNPAFARALPLRALGVAFSVTPSRTAVFEGFRLLGRPWEEGLQRLEGVPQ
jgi:hypothetical protein